MLCGRGQHLVQVGSGRQQPAGFRLVAGPRRPPQLHGQWYSQHRRKLRVPVPLGDVCCRIAARRPPCPIRTCLQKQPDNRLLPVLGRDVKWCGTAGPRLVDSRPRM